MDEASVTRSPSSGRACAGGGRGSCDSRGEVERCTRCCGRGDDATGASDAGACARLDPVAYLSSCTDVPADPSEGAIASDIGSAAFGGEPPGDGAEESDETPPPPSDETPPPPSDETPPPPPPPPPRADEDARYGGGGGAADAASSARTQATPPSAESTARQ